MSASSVAIFGDDTACDVRDEYVDHLRYGLSGKQATTQMIADWSGELADSDDGPVFWLALAATQWKYGRLEPRVKAKALAVIRKKLDLPRWEESDPKTVKAREKVLDRLRVQLESEQPPEKKVRVVAPPKPLAKVERFWKQNQIVAFRHEAGFWYLFITQRTEVHEYAGHLPYFELLEWRGKALPTAEEIADIPTTGFTFTVGFYRVKRPPADRLQFLDVKREPTHRGFVSYSIADWKTIDEHLAYWVEECEWFPKKGFRLPRKKAERT